MENNIDENSMEYKVAEFMYLTIEPSLSWRKFSSHDERTKIRHIKIAKKLLEFIQNETDKRTTEDTRKD